MKRSTVITTLGSTSLAVVALAVGRLGANDLGGSAGGRSGAGAPGGVATTGPDVIVGAIPDVAKYGTVSGISAYAIGTTSCNIGDTPLSWIDSGVNDSDHPVIAQNLFRLKNGRFEQIGQSWVKHGFCALDQTLCGACIPGSGGCDTLGIGCSDPYGAGLNGSTTSLGPRSQVNASTGVFPYPFTAPPAPPTIGRRLQVLLDDLAPAMNPASLYFAEAEYIHPEDAAAGNDNNNASYRRLTIGPLQNGSYNLNLTGATVQQKAAIFAWHDNGLGVGVPDLGVVIETIDVPGDGRFYVGSKVTQLGPNLWHYEFAIENYNSDRSGQGFIVPVPPGVVVSSIGYHDTFSHSGEPYSNADWTATRGSGAVSWLAENFTQNPNANALRWDTLYNFRFDASTPPVAASAALLLFKPGTPTSMEVTVPVPSGVVGDLNHDGSVNGQDLTILLGAWGTPDADLTGDGTTDGSDLTILLGAWQ